VLNVAGHARLQDAAWVEQFDMHASEEASANRTSGSGQSAICDGSAQQRQQDARAKGKFHMGFPNPFGAATLSLNRPN